MSYGTNDLVIYDGDIYSGSSRISPHRAQRRGDILNLGDPAPPLTVSSWVKGDKVEKFEPGKMYVVEFWATWCGPCLESIPHLTELAHKYKDKGVRFIGVDIWEQDAGWSSPSSKRWATRWTTASPRQRPRQGRPQRRRDGQELDAGGRGGWHPDGLHRPRRHDRLDRPPDEDRRAAGQDHGRRLGPQGRCERPW